MLLNVIFSFNRALQLDYLIKSILDKFKIDDYEIVVLYHTTGQHKYGYDKLIEKYKDYKNISFVERKEVWFDISYLRTFYSKENFRFFLRRNFLKKNGDNFKALLQKILRNSRHDWVMFNTDDGVFYDDVFFSEDIISLLSQNKENSSYRLYVGENLEGFPEYVEKKDNHYEWNYFTDEKITHWSYPFAVDGTIYHTQSLLKQLEKVVFHNPISLEIKMHQHIYKKKLLYQGYSPLKTKLVGTILNRVSTDTSNPTLNISVDLLNQKFIEGYELDLKFPNNITVVNLVPIAIGVKNENSYEEIYVFDEKGEKTQKSYSNEGTIGKKE